MAHDIGAPHVAIVDYGLGNLFSVRHACAHVGLSATITSDAKTIETSGAVILPGIGAFGDAMATLARLDLIGVLKDVAGSGRPFVGICLGMQLLMTESHEFGVHGGLGIVDGEVLPLRDEMRGRPAAKVPQVGWNRICANDAGRPWSGSLLDGLDEGTFMYFVHSYYVRPVRADVSLSVTRYADVQFCSSLAMGNIFACQFHPERSGAQGLQVYQNLARILQLSDIGVTR